MRVIHRTERLAGCYGYCHVAAVGLLSEALNPTCLDSSVTSVVDLD